jgi:Ca2+-binding EF-hand superfamily protein
MPNPLLEAIDADKDGELSAEEISNAVAALKSLDKNEDGKIDGSEMRPDFAGPFGGGGFPGGPDGGPFGPGGPGGPFGQGGPGGPGGDPAQMVERLMQMDQDADGKLSKEEVPERLQSTFARADRNEDGSLDKEEIQAMARERMGSGSPGPGAEGQRGFGGPGGGDFVAQMIERADGDKDGKLAGDEIPEFLRGRMDQVDSNKDGSLDKTELEAIGSRMRGGRGGAGGPGGPGGRGEGARRGNRPPVEESDDSKPKSDDKPADKPADI